MPRWSSIGSAACATSSPKRCSASGAIGAARVPVERAGDEVLGRARPPRRGGGRAEAGADGARVVVDRERERADGDHHRVARADLRELLAAARGRHVEGGDQLVRLEHVALGAGDELLDRQRAGCRASTRARPRRPDAYSGGSASPAGEEEPRLPPIVPRLRICGEPTVREAIARPGSRSSSSAIARVYVTPAPTRSEPLSRVPAREVADAREVEDRLRPRAAEVDVDHHVRPAPQRERLRMGRLGLQRLIPARGLQELHPRMIFAASRRARTCAHADHC